MVFQKKANKGGKQNQKTPMKKAVKIEEAADIFDDDFDDDDDMDSDDSEEVQKTPANKTPKGKQSLSEKRVSFQVPGKITPGKTPAKNTPATPKPNSAAKKQGTPAKVGLQQFQGMKKNQKQNSKQQQDDDDDEDDDDEDDSDFDGDDLDLDLDDEDDDNDEDGEDDDDDDDDDEDDDDDDDDDDEDEEEEKEKPKSKPQTPAKNQKQDKSPLKPISIKSEKQNAVSPKKETQSPANAKKVKTGAPTKTDVSMLDEEERRRQRNLTQLYVGNLPKETTVDELKALSPDILYCYLPKRNKANHAFAFLQFESEEKAEENYEILKKRKFRGQQLLHLDFVGEKSKNKKSDAVTQNQYSDKKLFISGLPVNATIYQVAKFFPKCYQITFNPSQSYRTASVWFWTPEDCTADFEANKDLHIEGVKISVLHALLHKSKPTKRKNKKFKKNGMGSTAPPSKKMKIAQEDSSDDDD